MATAATLEYDTATIRNLGPDSVVVNAPGWAGELMPGAAVSGVPWGEVSFKTYEYESATVSITLER